MVLASTSDDRDIESHVTDTERVGEVGGSMVGLVADTDEDWNMEMLALRLWKEDVSLCEMRCHCICSSGIVVEMVELVMRAWSR